MIRKGLIWTLTVEQINALPDHERRAYLDSLFPYPGIRKRLEQMIDEQEIPAEPTDPNAPSPEPSHGVAPARTVPDTSSDLPPMDADTPTEEDANGAESEEDTPADQDSDEIEEPAE